MFSRDRGRLPTRAARTVTVTKTVPLELVRYPGQGVEIVVARCRAAGLMISAMPPFVRLVLLACSYMSRVQHPLQKCKRSLLLRAPDDVSRGPFLNDDATIHEDHPVSHLPGKRHLMGDDDH